MHSCSTRTAAAESLLAALPLVLLTSVSPISAQVVVTPRNLRRSAPRSPLPSSHLSRSRRPNPAPSPCSPNKPSLTSTTNHITLQTRPAAAPDPGQRSSSPPTSPSLPVASSIAPPSSFSAAPTSTSAPPSEPRSTLSPSWHVERDVTDLSALFHRPRRSDKPSSATSSASTAVSPSTTASIYANARLDFYPANAANPAPAVPERCPRLSHQRHQPREHHHRSPPTGTFAFPEEPRAHLPRRHLAVAVFR